MKRCPECRRDYYDDSLLYCLDDGSALLEGPATLDEPATALLDVSVPPVRPEQPQAGMGADGGADEARTRKQASTTDQTAIFDTGTERQEKLAEHAEEHTLSANKVARPRHLLALAVA